MDFSRLPLLQLRDAARAALGPRLLVHRRRWSADEAALCLSAVKVSSATSAGSQRVNVDVTCDAGTRGSLKDSVWPSV